MLSIATCVTPQLSSQSRNASSLAVVVSHRCVWARRSPSAPGTRTVVVGPKLGQFVRDFPGVELEVTTPTTHGWIWCRPASTPAFSLADTFAGHGRRPWELDKGDESLAIAVGSSLLLDEVDLVVPAALDGAGLGWVGEDRVVEHLASGALVRVLKEWCPPFPGLFLYCPSRRQHPAALTALIETLRL